MPKKLEDIGLSEKEARVYMAALELGHATAEKLAEHAKVNRSTTYVQLESLMAKGLMSTHEEGKKTYFAPESPDALRQLIYKQKSAVNTREETLFQILPELLQHFESAGERPLVRFFPGKHGVTTVREEILRMREKELCVIFSSHEITNMYPDKILDDYTGRRAKFGIYSRAIHTNMDYFKKATTEHGEIRYLPGLPISIDIRVFDDKTAIFSLSGNPFVLVIQSKQMAASMKMIFNVLWNQAGAS